MNSEFNVDAAEVDQSAISENATSHTARLLRLCEGEDMEFFHDASGTAYVTIAVDNQSGQGVHFETHPLRSSEFRLTLQHRYYREYERAIPVKILDETLATLHARARFDGPERVVWLRSAGDGSGIEIDLGTDDWISAHIDASGWKLGPHQHRFYRSPSTKAFPLPERGGKLSELHAFTTNMESERDFALLSGFLVMSLYPRNLAPYVITILLGEQGSAKTSTSLYIQMLVDPSAAGVRSPSKNERDIAIAAQGSHLLVYDNLDVIPASVSDLFCRLSTGSTFSTRALYTDSSEILLYAQCPLVLNGIGDIATRGDLLDRSVVIHLSPIRDNQRKTAKELNIEWQKAWPRLFGALLDAVALSLRDRELVRQSLKNRPRMADFAEIAIAAEPAFGVSIGTVERALSDQRESASAQVVDVPLALALRKFMQERDDWEGSASDLDTVLKKTFANNISPQQWPRSAAALSRELERIAPALRQSDGIHYDRRAGTRRKIMLSRKPDALSETVQIPSLSSLPSHLSRKEDANDGNDGNKLNTEPKEFERNAYCSYNMREAETPFTDDAMEASL